MDLGHEEIKRLVDAKYSEVAVNPCGAFNFPVGKAFALKVGYPAGTLDELPQSLYESFTGANNPQPFVAIREGETILDVGCGAGLDLYFYARAAGPHGKVYGLDISEAMAAKARENMRKTGTGNAEVMTGPSDRLPFPDAFFDIVASNGIYNLSPDKRAVMAEVRRVLKPGGRTVFCEIVLTAPLSDEERKEPKDWFRCIGGALVEADFISLMKEAGFERIEVISRIRNARCGHRSAVCANMRAYTR